MRAERGCYCGKNQRRTDGSCERCEGPVRFIIRAVDGCGNDVAYDEVDSIEAVLRSLVSMNLGTLRTGQRIEITRQVTRKGDDKMMPRWTSVTPEWLPRAVEEAAQP